MRLVLLDDNGDVAAHYGEFTPELADAFFQDALLSIQFRKEFPQLVVQNELHLRQLSKTLSQMGLLAGDPDAIQQWMSPYIANVNAFEKQRTGLYARATKTIALHYDHMWGWIKSGMWAGLLKSIKWLYKFFTKKPLSVLLLLLPSNFPKP